MDQCSRLLSPGLSRLHTGVVLFVQLALSCLQCYSLAQNISDTSTVLPVNDTSTRITLSEPVTEMSAERVNENILPPTTIPLLEGLNTFLPTDIIDTKSPDQPRDAAVFTAVTMETVLATEVAGTELITELVNISSTELVTRVRSLCCPIDYTDVNGSCYMFHYEEVSFNEAREMCRFYDEGSLAKAEPVMEFMSYLFEELQYYSEVDRIWIGLIRGDNDSYTWLFDDTSLNESNWAVGQPSLDERLNCSAVNRNGTWELQPCVIPNLPYICQSEQVYCGELTTAPAVTTDEYTTAEITEPVTNATTKRATTTLLTTTLTKMTTTTKPPKPSTTLDMDDDATTEEITERVTEEVTTEEQTEPTRRKSTTVTTVQTTSTTAASTSMTSTKEPSTASTPTSGASSVQSTLVTGSSAGVSPDDVTVRAIPRDTTSQSTPTMTPTTPTPKSTRTPLSTINKILISIIVLCTVLAFLIGAIIIYLLHKRKQAKKGAYDVDGTELDDIKSVEDIAGPSTSSDGADGSSDVTNGVANTSFINDELPGFSGGYFNGLRGKTYSYDVT